MKYKAPKKNPKSNKKLIIVGIAIIIILLAIIAFLIFREKEDESKRNVVVNRDNVEEVTEDMINQKYIEPGYYNVVMPMEWHFKTGDAVSEDAYVENVEENTNDVYFDVFLADDESESLLESPVIPRGSEMESIALDKPLEAGTHDCVMVYHLIDEEQNTLSTLRVGFKIIVEK